MKKIRVIIIHGWGGTPGANWFPWLKDELNKRGFLASVPQMPSSDFPQKREWIAAIQKVVGKPDSKTILVGHSLGAIAILRYLGTLKDGEKIGASILVSGFPEPLNIPEIANFFDVLVDFEKIKKNCTKFVVINSDNDHYVPLEMGKKMREGLEAEFVVMEQAGHIQAPYGKFELPIALEKILEISK